MGDLLRSVGQNPTLAEIADLQKTIKEANLILIPIKKSSTDQTVSNLWVYLKITSKDSKYLTKTQTVSNLWVYLKITSFQVFDKDHTGYIGVGELRYILTSIGEKLTDSEFDELLKGVNVTSDGNVDYVEFVKSILDQ